MIASTREGLAYELTMAIDARRARCLVIGLGFIGSTLMDALVLEGFQPQGLDRNADIVDRFGFWMTRLHPASDTRWSTTLDTDALRQAEVILVAVRTPPQDDGSVNLEPLEAVAAMLRRCRTDSARLILVESTLPCGTTRRFSEWLSAGPSDFIAHSPERLSVGHDSAVLRSTPHLVGGMDSISTEVATCFLSKICDRVVPVSSPEVSELSKLLENAFLTMGISLAVEATAIAHRLGISAQEVCMAAATKPFGYFPFYPGPGVGGHCLPNDLRILAATAAALGYTAPLIKATAAVSASAPTLVIDRLDALLRFREHALAGSRILLVGVGFKNGTGDTTETPAGDIVRLLRSRGATPVFTDSLVPHFQVDGNPVERVEGPALGIDKFAACVILSGDRALRAECLSGAADVVLDAGGGRMLIGRLKGGFCL